MTEAEDIAATLTPAQIDMLRNPEDNSTKLFFIQRWDPAQKRNIAVELFGAEFIGETTLTTLGKEVLAVIERSTEKESTE